MSRLHLDSNLRGTFGHESATNKNREKVNSSGRSAKRRGANVTAGRYVSVAGV